MNTSDWRTFLGRVPEWRERYLRRKNEELIDLLGDEAYTPTERFWRAKDRMGVEARVLTTCLDGHSKGKVAWYLFLMHGHGMIGEDDLGAFSEELQEEVRVSVRLSAGLTPSGESSESEAEREG